MDPEDDVFFVDGMFAIAHAQFAIEQCMPAHMTLLFPKDKKRRDGETDCVLFPMPDPSKESQKDYANRLRREARRIDAVAAVFLAEADVWDDGDIIGASGTSKQEHVVLMQIEQFDRAKPRVYQAAIEGTPGSLVLGEFVQIEEPGECFPSVLLPKN